MWLVIGLLNRVALPAWVLLLLEIAVGAVVYVAASIATKHGYFAQLKDYIFRKRK
jgi:hypothetical protein